MNSDGVRRFYSFIPHSAVCVLPFLFYASFRIRADLFFTLGFGFGFTPVY